MTTQETEKSPNKFSWTKPLPPSTVAVWLIMIVGAIFFFSSGSKSPDSPASVTKTDTPALKTTQTSVEYVAPQLPVPHHNFSYTENGEYGYEQALSDDDQKAGTATKPLVMVRYLGENNGTLRVQLFQSEDIKNVFSCQTPCEFVKATTYVGRERGPTQTIRVADGSVISAILDDAMGGELEVYKKPRK